MANNIGVYPQANGIVASGTVAGVSTSLAAFTVYTPPAPGIYEIAVGFYVTAAGSTGATIQAQVLCTNPAGFAINTAIAATVGATTVGADSSGQRTNVTSIFFNLTTLPVQLLFAIGGSPTTNPTFTYWYVITKKF